jgi:hypothetical protein
MTPTTNPRFNPLPGVGMLKYRSEKEWFCTFHQMVVWKPEWVIWQNDYHAACPLCFSQEAQKLAKVTSKEPASFVVDVDTKIPTYPRKVVTCHNGHCGFQTYTDEFCKVCRFAFCHKHLLKFGQIRLCRECEEKTVSKRSEGCQFGSCDGDSETWCEICKKAICRTHQSGQRDYLCKHCAGDLNYD